MIWQAGYLRTFHCDLHPGILAVKCHIRLWCSRAKVGRSAGEMGFYHVDLIGEARSCEGYHTSSDIRLAPGEALHRFQ